MRDDENAHIRAADLGDALAGQPDGVGIEAAVGFVEDGELRLEHGELQDFGPLHFAAGKTIIHITPGKFRIHLELFHLRFEFLAKLLHRNQLFAFLAIRPSDIRRGMAQKVRHLYAGNRHRPLEGHENTGPRALVRLHLEHVKPRAIVTDQFDRSAGDLIARMPHDGQAERTLSRAVRPHQRMDLASLYLKIHSLENRLILNGNMQISNLQRFSHFTSSFVLSHSLDIRHSTFVIYPVIF